MHRLTSIFLAICVPCLSPTAQSQQESSARIGPFEITSPDGESRLGIGFASQVRATAEDKAISERERELTASLTLRRIRFLLRGSFFDSTLRVGLQLSLAPASLELLDAWADYRFHPHFQVRIGQFKILSTRYRQQSFSTGVLVDWATVASRFGSERQLGIMVHNGGWDATPWAYGFGVFTGINARASFENGIATQFGDKLPNPSNLADPEPLGDLHPEIVANFGYSSEGIGARSNTDADRGPLRYLVNLGAAWDVSPAEHRDFAFRLSPEVLLKMAGFSFNLVGHMGFFEPHEGGIELAMLGALNEVAYRFNEHWELAARYGLISHLDALRSDARASVDDLVAAADPDDRDAIRTQANRVGTLATEHEVAGGLNVYIIGHQLKWHSDVAILLSDYDSESLHNIRVRSELQLAF